MYNTFISLSTIIIERARRPYSGINNPFFFPNSLVRASLRICILSILLAKQKRCRANGVSFDITIKDISEKSFAADSNCLVCLVQTGVSRDGTVSISLYQL